MSRKQFSDLQSVLSDTLTRKQEAAQARQRGAESGVEHSRDVFAQACATIAERFAGDGYRYAKSRSSVVRRAGVHSFELAFQTSHHNIPGRHVALNMSAHVASKPLEQWRTNQAHPWRKGAWVAGGLVHLLGGQHTLLQWELADAKTREETIGDIVKFITITVFPYFGLFTQPDATITLLTHHLPPEFSVASAVEYALCFGSKADAQAILSSYLTSHPDLAASVKGACRRYENEFPPKCFASAYADQVAWVITAYKLALVVAQ